MIGTIALILVFQLAGEVLVRLVEIPVPGPVAGMLLLFIALAVRGSVPEEVSAFANGLLSHLSLLFVPAGVGVIVHAERLSGIWPTILVAVIVSTLLAVAVTALVLSGVRRLQNGRDTS